MNGTSPSVRSHAFLHRERMTPDTKRAPSRHATLWCIGLISIALVLAGLTPAAAETVKIVQKHRTFSAPSVDLNAGDTIQFGNEDEFIHQVYVRSPAFNIDTDESPPGNAILVKFTVPGTFEVHCHIHPKMLLVVTVK
jgi:plastocyanin